MPRTGGVYSPPAGTKGTPNTTIQSVPYNTLIDDLTADANAPRPVTAGGTGASSASAARAALGADNADNLTSGTLADARLPTTMAGKTFSTSCTFQQGATFSAAVQINSTLSTTSTITMSGANNGLELGAGSSNTPFVDFHSGSTPTDYDARILASGGNGSVGGGALSITAGGGLNLLSTNLFGVGATFSSDVKGNVLFSTSGNINIDANGNRHVWFRTAAGVNRGLVYHDNAGGSLNLNTYNASGVFQHSFVTQETGGVFWSGHFHRIGGASASGEYQIVTNNTGQSYRILGDNGGGLYIQRSNDRFVANAPTLLSFNAGNDATFALDVYARRFWASANGDAQAVRIGDDAWIGDINVTNTISIRGVNNSNWGLIQPGNDVYGFGCRGIAGRFYYGDQFFIQTDGNQYLPMYGAYLGDVLNTKASVYTGSNQDELNFPIGHHVLLQTSSSGTRNSAVTVYLFNTGQYQLNVSGSPLTGTWRMRGAFSGSGFLMQRVG